MRHDTRGAQRSRPGQNDGWLIGPTWLYVSVAIVIFVTAAVVAVVQATDADDATSTVAVEEDRAAISNQPQAQARPSASDGDPIGTEDARPTPPVQTQPQATEQQDVGETAELAEEPGPHQSSVDEAPRADQGPSAPTPEPDNPVRGFIIPIAGACVTEFDGHLPAAERAYRNDGVHEGLDFYQWASCTTVDYSVEILAAKAGVVIRADLDYVDITPADWDRFIAANWEGEQILDELRGRQVWIDHGRGIVTRYAHLSAIAEGIATGVEVRQGQVIGYPGESGQQEVYNAPGTDIHLHFEIRIGNSWLGQGETPQAARQLYLEAFDLAPPSSQ